MDAILIDAFDADGIAPSLAKSDSFASAARQLNARGMLVMNFWGSCERSENRYFSSAGRLSN